MLAPPRSARVDPDEASTVVDECGPISTGLRPRSAQRSIFPRDDASLTAAPFPPSAVILTKLTRDGEPGSRPTNDSSR